MRACNSGASAGLATSLASTTVVLTVSTGACACLGVSATSTAVISVATVTSVGASSRPCASIGSAISLATWSAFSTLSTFSARALVFLGLLPSSDRCTTWVAASSDLVALICSTTSSGLADFWRGARSVLSAFGLSVRSFLSAFSTFSLLSLLAVKVS